MFWLLGILFQMTVTRKEAKELVLRHIPEILVNLVGQQAARNGAAKVFETLQDQVLSLRFLLYISIAESYNVSKNYKNLKLNDQAFWCDKCLNDLWNFLPYLQTLNKQLFYEILEHLSNALFPELLVNYAEQKMRSFSWTWLKKSYFNN